jgi:hypothetical protein
MLLRVAVNGGPRRGDDGTRGANLTAGSRMQLELTDDEAAALLRLLNQTIADDRFPLSPRIKTLRAIRAKLPGAPPEPPSAQPPTPEERDPRRAPRQGRRRR